VAPDCEDDDLDPNDINYELYLMIKEDKEMFPHLEGVQVDPGSENVDEHDPDVEHDNDNISSNLEGDAAETNIKSDANTTTRSNKIKLSNKRQHPGTSTPGHKKAKVVVPAYQKSTQKIHDDSDSDSGFEAYYDKEALTLDPEAFYGETSESEEDDEDDKADEDEVDSDLNINTNVEDNMVENNNTNINSNLDEVETNIKSDPDDDTVEKEDLTTLPYWQLRLMCNERRFRDLYGDEVLLKATMKANFNRMVLFQLRALDRAKVPKHYHRMLDRVIYKKSVEALDEVGDLGYKAYYPEAEPCDDSWKIEYENGGHVVIPSSRPV
jgi:hypothetical protein